MNLALKCAGCVDGHVSSLRLNDFSAGVAGCIRLGEEQCHPRDQGVSGPLAEAVALNCFEEAVALCCLHHAHFRTEIPGQLG